MALKEKQYVWLKQRYKDKRYFNRKAADLGFPTLGALEKAEIILDWYLNGGMVLDGRYKRLELARLLELSLKEFDELLDEAQSNLGKAFENVQSIRKHVFQSASRLSRQIQEDRARAVENDEAISKTLQWLYRELENIYQVVPKTEEEKIIRDQAIQGLLKQIRAFHYQRTEALRALAMLDDGGQKYLAMYLKDRENPLPSVDTPDGDSKASVLTYEGAIALIEDQGVTKLPQQKLEFTANKNPVKEFANLMKNHGEERVNGSELEEPGKTTIDGS